MKTQKDIQKIDDIQLEEYAKEQFGTDLDRRHNIEELREQVANMQRDAKQSDASAADQQDDESTNTRSDDRNHPVSSPGIDSQGDAEAMSSDDVADVLEDEDVEQDAVVTVTITECNQSAVDLRINGKNHHFPINKPTTTTASVAAVLADTVGVKFKVTMG